MLKAAILTCALQALAALAPPARCTIAIQPLGKVDSAQIKELVASLGEIFACPVQVLAPTALPEQAFYLPRNRYRADRLLTFLEVAPGQGKILGVAAVDISVTKEQYPDWGVFGYATISGRSGVVSTFRLTRKPSQQHPLRERLLKVTIHEIGHTFGLPHCESPSCVMVDCRGTIATVDAEPVGFCAACKEQIGGLLRPEG